MAGNSFGQLFKITTFGESHGPAIGVVIDGVPSRLPLSEADLQKDLTAVGPVKALSPPNVKNLIKQRSFPVFLKVRLPGRRWPYLSAMKTSVPRIMRISRTSSVPGMRIIVILSNTASAIIAAAGVHPDVRPLAVWLPGQWLKRSWPNIRSRSLFIPWP